MKRNGSGASDPSWQWLPSPHMRSPRRSPVTGIVQHYTAGGSGRALAKWLAGPDARVSAHVLICRDGHIIQQVSFGDEAWHAGEVRGKGFWKDRPQPENVNRFTIGIENSNYGWLLRDNAGAFYLPKRTVRGFEPGKPYQGPTPIRMADHLGEYRWWEPYTDELVASNIRVLREICDLYPAVARDDILGHSDVSPHRKLDPGPAWPAEHVLNEVFGNAGSSDASLLVAGGEDPSDEEIRPRDHYDEDLEMCVEPDPATE